LIKARKELVVKVIYYKDVEAKRYETDTAKNAWGRAVIGKADGADNFCMRVFELHEGGSSDLHQHDWEHEVFVHSGQGEVMIDGKTFDLGPGSVIFIPGGNTHQLKNTGKEPFVFVCVIPSGPPEI
jgi:quercetin dioxygenase-like cupin family protein